MTNLLLLDHSSDIRKILSEQSDLNALKIISFDIESNSILSELNIDHELMENYLDLEDEQNIENFALEKSLTWYKQKEIETYLKFENINLGWLWEIEFHHYFLKVIKHFLGIIKIIDKEHPSKILASFFLSSLIESMDLNNQPTVQKFPKINSKEFIFNSFEIPINLGIKKINLKISRNFALKLKNVSENVTNLFFNLKYKPNNSVKNKILLLEFNPIPYHELISEISSFDDDIILLNERRPAIWNLQSLNIVRNSKSKILLLSTHEKKLFREIKDQKNIISKKLEMLFSENDLFSQFFSFKNFSFWNAIKDDFISVCFQRSFEAIKRFLCAKNFFENNKIHCILTMYNASAEERTILSVAHKYQIPSILMQHGLYPQNNSFKKFLPVLGFLPNLKLKEAVWGLETKNHFVKLGINETDLILTGSPRHDEFFKYDNSEQSTDSILIATNVIMGQNYRGHDSRVFEKYEIFLKELFEEIHNVSKKKLIIKLHPGTVPNDIIPKIIDETKLPLEISKTGNIFEFLIKSDIVISTEFSTIILDAMILKKPTITLLFNEDEFIEEPIIKSGATTYATNIKEFSEVLDKILNDTEFRDNLVEKGNDLINKYMIQQGTSSHFLAKYIHNM
jgi:hypothetical protein